MQFTDNGCGIRKEGLAKAPGREHGVKIQAGG